jgi:hypothetical protein
MGLNGKQEYEKIGVRKTAEKDSIEVKKSEIAADDA